MVFLAGDRRKVVISPKRLRVAGGTKRLRGPVEEHRASGHDLVELHGSSLRGHLVVLLAAGAGCVVTTATGAPALTRLLVGLLLLATLARTWTVALRTRRIAHRLRHDEATFALTATPDRATLDEALTLVDRIWHNQRLLPDLLGPVDTVPLLERAVAETAAALRRRQRLREIRAEQGTRKTAGLPASSAAVLAHQEQRTRAAGLWADADREVHQHLAALRATADAGTDLMREVELGHAARRTRAALDDVEAGAGPVADRAGTEMDRQTTAYVTAYRELTRRYGAEVYA
jgi:hypothetical protein